MRAAFARLLRRVLSVPVYLKIVGVGFLVALLFGGVTYLQTRRGMSQMLRENLARDALSLVRSVATSLERPLVTGDLFSVDEELRKVSAAYPEIRYLIVREKGGRILVHTFKDAVPADLLSLAHKNISPEGELDVLDSNEGLMFDAVYPILGGSVGTLELGLSDRVVLEQLSSLRRTIVWSLILCCAFGLCLAAILAHLLTNPIDRLVAAVNRIRDGDLGARAEISASDEIGALSEAFNEMVVALEEARHDSEEKERIRVALMERLVNVQEDERKNIARELHDQIGQSLSATLLSIHQNCKYISRSGSLCQEMEQTIYELIDDVHKLAWQMRPPILDDYGLDSALQHYLKKVQAQSNLEIDYQFTSSADSKRLPSQVELTLYRVAQEAVLNVIRHAKASRASVVLLKEEQSVALLVEDDGCGFDPTNTNGDGGIHLGLIGLKERVGLCSGSLVMESAKGVGTTLKVKVPLN